MVYTLNTLQRVPLGKQGENLARVVIIDVSKWLTKWPDARVELVASRPNEDTVYIADTYMVDTLLTWPITAADVGIVGTGHAELRAVNEHVVAKSKVFETVISPCLEGTEGDPPDAVEAWVNTVTDAAAQAKEYAEGVPEAISLALAEAKASGEFDGVGVTTIKLTEV